MNQIKQRIKAHEGFRDEAYNDSLGIPTIGWGHMILPEDNIQMGVKYSVDHLSEIFDKDFEIAFKAAKQLIEKHIPNLYTQGLDQGDIEHIQGVLLEMLFQMGYPRGSKFKKTLKALDDGDFKTAANEMLDSRWHKQVTNRAERLMVRLENV